MEQRAIGILRAVAQASCGGRGAGETGRGTDETHGQLKDPSRNGGRTLAELHEHNARDGVVGRGRAGGREPGRGRERVPGTQEMFARLTAASIETGAHRPRR